MVELGDPASFDLAELVEALHRAGFRVDTRQYLTANRLVLSLARQGSVLASANDYVRLLGPIFCTSPEEQHSFKDVVAEWTREELQSRQMPAPPFPFGLHVVCKWVAGPLVLALVLALGISILARQVVPVQVTVQVQKEIKTEEVDRSPTFRPAPEATLTVDGTPARLDWNARAVIRFDREKNRLTVSAQLTGFSSQSVELTRHSLREVVLILDALAPIEDKGSVGLPISRELRPAYPPRPPKWNSQAVIWVVTIGGLGFFVLIAMRFLKRTLVLKRSQSEVDSRTRELIMHEPAPTVLGQGELRKLMVGLRQRVGQDALELDIQGTVAATVASGGLFSPLFVPKKSVPEYLALIDRRNFNDHFARLADDVLMRFAQYGVIVERYYFSEDPRWCRNDTASFVLRDLIAARGNYTLLLYTETANCFNALSGEMEDWVTQVMALPRGILWTPVPAYRWTEREWKLVDRGLTVIPLTRSGFRAYAEHVDNWRPARLFPAAFVPPYPSMLVSNPRRWLERDGPSEDLTDRLALQLQAYLGERGFAWLCACAIYPEITWTLTLYLAESLRLQSAEVESILPALARLPWLRYAHMPDWLRMRLFDKLSGEYERAIRDALRELLRRALRDMLSNRNTKSIRGILEHLLLRDEIDYVQAFPEGSPFRDAVFLSFMTSTNVSPTDFSFTVELGDLLRKLGFNTSPRWHLQRPNHLRRRLRAFLFSWPVMVRAFAAACGGIIIFFIARGAGTEAPRVNSGAFIGPTTRVVVADSSGSTELWEVAGRRNLGTLATQEQVTAVAANAVGDLIATGADDGGLTLWDPDSRRLLATLAKGHAGRVTSLAFSSAGGVMASGGLDGRIGLWDVQRHRQLQMLNAQQGEVLALAFHPTGLTLASGGADGSVKLWDASGRRLLSSRQQAHAAAVTALAFSPDGGRVVSGGKDRAIVVWEPATDRSFALSAHRDQIVGLAFAGNDQKLVSGSADSELAVWNLVDHKSVTLNAERSPARLQFIANGASGAFMTGTEAGRVDVWSWKTPTSLLTLSAISPTPPGPIVETGEQFLRLDLAYRGNAEAAPRLKILGVQHADDCQGQPVAPPITLIDATLSSTDEKRSYNFALQPVLRAARAVKAGSLEVRFELDGKSSYITDGSGNTVPLCYRLHTPVIASFTARPSTIRRGSVAQLCYEVNRVDSLSITPDVGSVSNKSGTCVPVSPQETTTYQLSVVSADGETSTAVASVNVFGLAPVISSLSFVRGRNLICYTVQGATRLVLSPELGDIAPNSSACVRVGGTPGTVYTLVAFNESGERVSRRTRVPEEGGGARLSLNPPTITRGDIAQLCLQSANIDRVTISPSVGPTSATPRQCFMVSPTSSTTYKAKVTTTDGGQAIATATLRVVPRH
jgi:WD40 repeat protein